MKVSENTKQRQVFYSHCVKQHCRHMEASILSEFSPFSDVLFDSNTEKATARNCSAIYKARLVLVVIVV